MVLTIVAFVTATKTENTYDPDGDPPDEVVGCGAENTVVPSRTVQMTQEFLAAVWVLPTVGDSVQGSQRQHNQIRDAVVSLIRTIDGLGQSSSSSPAGGGGGPVEKILEGNVKASCQSQKHDSSHSHFSLLLSNGDVAVVNWLS